MEFSTENSKKIWNENALFWDNAMGDESNDFHLEVVRPKVTEFLDINKDDYILDIACGNGNYSAFLAQNNISTLAFDFSEKMIELAKKRQEKYCDKIEFVVADATNEQNLKSLKRERPFTKAVSCMAIMDISDINSLFKCVYNLLDDNGTFVFATQHPCFVTKTDKYMTKDNYYGIALENQVKKQCYYHRSLQDIFSVCFDAGFSVTNFAEVCYKNEKEIPEIIVVKLQK